MDYTPISSFVACSSKEKRLILIIIARWPRLPGFIFPKLPGIQNICSVIYLNQTNVWW